MPEVEVQYEPDRRRLQLSLSNRGQLACELALVDMYGVNETGSVKLAPGARIRREVSLEGAGNWYDLALKAEALNAAWRGGWKRAPTPSPTRQWGRQPEGSPAGLSRPPRQSTCLAPVDPFAPGREFARGRGVPPVPW